MSLPSSMEQERRMSRESRYNRVKISAIARGIHRAKWTYENIGQIKAEFQRLGFSRE